MTRLIIDGGTLTASRDNRTVAGMLVPFGEKCRSNLGVFSVGPGVFELPEDVGVLNATLDHDREQPRARFVSATETDRGIEASFRVADGREGDELLAEIESGKRRALSVEARGVVIRAGRAIAGKVFGASFVKAGAFPTATLYAADAADLPDTLMPDENSTSTTEEEIVVDGVTYVRKTTTTYQTQTAPKDPNNADPSAQEDSTVTDTTSTDATASDQLQATLPGSVRHKATKKAGDTLLAALRGKSIGDAVQLMNSTLLAALDVISVADGTAASQAQWLGEIYSSKTYVRRFANLLAHEDLQGVKALGWRFVSGKTPVVAPYTAGAQPNSNEVKTEAVTLDALRLAGAGSVDRGWLDFPDQGFWAGYFREQTNSYERVIDGISRDFMIANATPIVADAVPTDVATAASYLVDGIAAILDAERSLPTFALCGTGLWKALALTRAEDLLAYIKAMLNVDLETFNIVPSSAPDLVGKVLVGSKDAATLFELPGAPVRVDTVAIATGQVDRGLFGYHAELLNDASSLALVGPDAG